MLSRFVIASCLLLFPLVGYAQKIGYVGTDAIRDKYEPNMQAQERLNATVEEWKIDLARRQKDIEDLELEIKKNRLIWSEAEKQFKHKDLEQKKRDRDLFTRDKFEPGGEYDKLAETLFGAVWQKIYAAIQKVAAIEGYDIVWDKSSQPLIYVNAKYDLTVKVMKELGIDADELARKQQEVVDSDPRNKAVDDPRRRKSRRGQAAVEAREADTKTKEDAKIPVFKPETPHDATPEERQVPR